MTSLTQSLSAPAVKALVAGMSGSGKTCSLAPLLWAGYTLRIIDLENKLLPLASLMVSTGLSMSWAQDQVTDLLNMQTDVQKLSIKYQYTTAGLVPDPSFPVWSLFQQLIFNWPGLGPISQWSSNDVLVVDSLSSLANASLAWNEKTLGTAHGRHIGKTSDDIQYLFDMIRSDHTPCNAIIICHLEPRPAGLSAGEMFPMVPGKKLPGLIPTFFDWVGLCESHPQPNGPSLYTFDTRPRPGYSVMKSPPDPRVQGQLPSSHALGMLFEATRGVGPSGLSFLNTGV